jgi:hypothetical protein
MNQVRASNEAPSRVGFGMVVLSSPTVSVP